MEENESFPVAIGEDLTLDGAPARIIEGSGDGVHVSVLESLVLVPEQLTLTLEMRTTRSAAPGRGSQRRSQLDGELRVVPGERALQRRGLAAVDGHLEQRPLVVVDAGDRHQQAVR